MKNYSWEFEMLVDYEEEKVEPIYYELTEEERDAFRKKNPDMPFIPKKILEDEKVTSVVKKKNIKVKRRIPDIRNIKIQQVLKKGKVCKNKFVVEENESTRYVVKGKYKSFKKILDSLDNGKAISFYNNKINE